MATATSQAHVAQLLQAVRGQASERMWGAGVELARRGAVEGVASDGEEIELRVKTRSDATPREVFLWPADPDWGCDCGKEGVCVHVVAAAISVSRTSQEGGRALPRPRATYQVRIRYRFGREGQALTLSRDLVYGDGRSRALDGALAEQDVMTSRVDVQAESLLAMHVGGPLSADQIRSLLAILEGEPPATLDGQPIELSAAPVQFRVRVVDEGEGFKVGLYRPAGIDELFRGAALIGRTLHPTSHGNLQQDQRQILVRGVRFAPSEASVLVGEYLPRLRRQAPVDIETTRLPSAEQLVPHVSLRIKERTSGLEVEANLVYGDPPVARVTSSGGMEQLSGAVVLPSRDRAAERAALHSFSTRFGRIAPFRLLLPPSQAIEFLQNELPRHRGHRTGTVDPKRFKVAQTPVVARLDLVAIEHDTRPGWKLDVHFDNASGAADPMAVLDAWRSGASLVPLMDGGWAPLPTDWLKQHGPLLRELLEARDAQGRVARNATAALVELLEETDAEVPPDLDKLRTFLAGDDGLPDVPVPTGLHAELRPYQVVGFRWLRFLRDMDLHGILADDMGLGKTVQALAAMLDAGGRHLVIAPTSVLRNWALEANRFAPELSVNLYHGPNRTLDDSAVTLTSYALLRIDLDLIRERSWTYMILDEAQAIKNPSSQTARAAIKVNAQHRLALTGTPVENRLEELWSQFRFLMPGLLSSLEAFRDRFARPIELGDPGARKTLRNRVRPYIMRRLKSQVAQDLPPLTEVVIRCELSDAQRKTYNTVRLLGRREVQEVLSGRKNTMAVLEALLRMRQACCAPALLPGDLGDGVGSAKLDRMEELLVELVLEDHKALVFSQWTSMLDLVETRLEALGIEYARLDGSTRDRQTVIDRFQSPDGPPVFLLSLKAGGTGLNLTAADYVMHLDPWWNPAVERQATDRAHRIGQDKPVVSYRLIAAETVEERILDLQDAKRDLADAALSGAAGLMRALSADELRSLFEA